MIEKKFKINYKHLLKSKTLRCVVFLAFCFMCCPYIIMAEPEAAPDKSPAEASSELQPSQDKVEEANTDSSTQQSAQDPKKPYAKDIDRYMITLQQKVQKNWRCPKNIGKESTTVSFVIKKDGRLLSPHISKASNSDELDKAALFAIKFAAPYDPLPESYPKSSIEIELKFEDPHQK